MDFLKFKIKFSRNLHFREAEYTLLPSLRPKVFFGFCLLNSFLFKAKTVLAIGGRLFSAQDDDQQLCGVLPGLHPKAGEGHFQR